VYCGNSVPIVGIGFLSAAVSAISAHVWLAVLITALSVIAFLIARQAERR
jgi:hypothetical protein